MRMQAAKSAGITQESDEKHEAQASKSRVSEPSLDEERELFWTRSPVGGRLVQRQFEAHPPILDVADLLLPG